MTQIVLGFAGAALGSAVGIGPSAGYAIGSGLGAMFTKKKQPAQQEVNTVQDLSVPGTEYGQFIPWGQGAFPVLPQVMWNSQKRIITTNLGGGGGGGKGDDPSSSAQAQTVKTYDVDLYLLLTDMIIKGIGRIWINGKLSYNLLSTAGDDTVLASLSTPHWDRLQVYTGAVNQMPDPVYEAAVGTADAPAYRHRGTVFIESMHLGESGQIPVIVMEVIVDGSVEYASPGFVNYHSLPVLGSGVNSYYNINDMIWVDSVQKFYLICDTRIGTMPTVVTFGYLMSFDPVTDTYGTPVFTSNLGHGSGGGMEAVYDPSSDRIYVLSFNVNKIFVINPHNDTVVDELTDIALNNVRTLTIGGVGGKIHIACLNTSPIPDDGRVLGYQAGAGFTTVQNIPTSSLVYTDHLSELYCATNIGITFPSLPDGVFRVNVLNSGTYDINHSIDFVANPPPPMTPPHKVKGVTVLTYDSLRLRVWVRVYTENSAPGTWYLCYIDCVTKEIVWVDDISPGNSGNSYVLKYDEESDLLMVAGINTPSTLYFYSPEDTYDLIGSIPSGDTVLGESGHTYQMGEHSVIRSPTDSMLYIRGRTTPSGNELQNLTVLLPPVILPRITITSPSLKTVVDRWLEYSGVEPGTFDTTPLEDITRLVRCFRVDTLGPCRSPLELLASAYFFDCSGRSFVPRGSAPALSIPYSALGATTPGGFVEPCPIKELDEFEVPAQIAVEAMNIDNDYAKDIQFSDRLTSVLDNSISTVQMAGLGLTPEEMKGAANTILADQMMSAYTVPISIMADADHCALEPTDVVTVTTRGGSTLTLRIVKGTDSYPILAFETVLTNATILQETAPTDTTYPAPSTTVDPLADSIAYLLDIPMMRDSDAGIGLYITVKRDGTGSYPGTVIYSSPDNVTFTPQLTIDQESVMGVCDTILGDWTGPRIIDSVNSVEVDVGEGVLESATEAEVIADQRINAVMVGSEFMQFIDAEELSAGKYRLTLLLRGGRGTGWAMVDHVADERFVLLQEGSMRRLTLDNSMLGVTRYYKAVTIGKHIADVTPEAFTCYGVSLKPFAPVDLDIVRDASNNAAITFERRTRVSTRMTGPLGFSYPLGEAEEKWDVDIYSDDTFTTVVRTITAFTTNGHTVSVAYSAANQTTDGLTPGDPISVRAYQRSQIVGRGYALEGTA